MTKQDKDKTTDKSPTLSKEQLRLYRLTGIIFLVASVIFLLIGLIFKNNIYATGVPFFVLGMTFLALSQQDKNPPASKSKKK